MRRYLPLTVAGLIVVGFAIALIISISGGSSKTPSDVTKLDPNAQQPPELADTNDVTGTRLPNISYVAFDQCVVIDLCSMRNRNARTGKSVAGQPQRRRHSWS